MYSLYLENQDDRQAAEMFGRLMMLWHHCEITPIQDAGGAGITVYRDPTLKAEGYRLTCDGKTAAVYGNGKAGVVYGLSALLTHYGPNGFADIDLLKEPRLPFRGVQLYMPPKEGVEGFKRIIDMLAFMKLNTLILEVGGGMEYKKHPEINEGWERLCTSLTEFPGGPTGFQNTDVYHKDSVHTELGGGSFLPQETVRELVDYAKGYGINVVPELQMLSHAYYITAAYPQYAERHEDYFPDTTCPHNEDAYTLYFELAEEVIDVFRPRMVSIGHDEIRVLGLCDTCKNYSGHELLAYEINRLHTFYKEKGIRISMWCEKLQSTKNYFTGEMSGGGLTDETDGFGRRWITPATYEAIKEIPKDILFLDWLYGWSWDSQEESENNGFRQIFGNFHGEITRGWERRLASPCVIGGETSSWCRADEFTLGRDGIIGDFWYSAMMLWDTGFDENNHNEYMEKMRNEMPLIREMLRDKPSASISMKQKANAVYTGGPSSDFYSLAPAELPERGIWKQLKKELPTAMYGTPLGQSALVFPVEREVKHIAFVHTCMAQREAILSYRLPIKESCPAVYAIRYVDGVTLFAHVCFGLDVGHIEMDFGRHIGYEGATPEDPWGFDTDQDQCPDPPLYAFNKPWKNSLLYSAIPFFFGHNNCAYIMEWENPRPDIKVERVFAINNVKTKEEQVILFCAAVV